MLGNFCKVTSVKNGVEKDITNELNFHDVVEKVTLNGKSIDFKELHKLIPELIDFQYGEKPVKKNKKFKNKKINIVL